MLQKSDFRKITTYSRWFEDAEFDTRYLVGITTKDKSILPQWLQDSARDVDGLKLANDANYVVTEANHCQLKELDEDDNVKAWGIIRKRGIIEFSDDQIWDAFIEHLNQFSLSTKSFDYSREQYMDRDPIGYEECMAAMSRILYRALGYI